MNKNKKIKFPDWMSLFPFFISQLVLYPIALYTRKVIIEINSASPILVFLLHFFELAIFFQYERIVIVNRMLYCIWIGIVSEIV